MGAPCSRCGFSLAARSRKIAAMSQSLRPLVEAAKRGERQALEQLAACIDRFVRIFHGRLSGHLRRSHGSTIDFVLEGIAEALRDLELHEYRDDDHFYAWIASSIRHQILDVARREDRVKRAGRPAPLDGERDLPRSPDPSPSQIVARAEVREVVARALIELQVEHPLEMEVVVRKVFESESWPTIRALLDLSSDRRARTLFAHGIALLQPRLEAALGASFVDEMLTTR